MKLKFSTRLLFLATTLVAFLLTADRYLQMQVMTNNVCDAALMTNVSDNGEPGDMRISIESVRHKTSITDRVLFRRCISVNHRNTCTQKDGSVRFTYYESDIVIGLFGIRAWRSQESPTVTMWN